MGPVTPVRLRLRVAVAVLGALVLAGCTSSTPAEGTSSSSSATAPSSTTAATVDVSAELAALEQEYDVRIGVSAVDTGTGTRVEHRADERFGYASTLKAFAAGVFLREVPSADRARLVTWSQTDVDAAGYAPVTGAAVATGLTAAELAEAAVRQSDNLALNLVLDLLGGPAGLDAALADLGDTTTDVVHEEPALNDVDPATSTADTTTPAAFTDGLRALLAPGALTDADRSTLLSWMSGNATGDTLVRAGAPAGWVVADKSGGAGGIRNDIAVVTPPGRDPVLVTVLTEELDPTAAYEDAVVARTAAAVLTALG
ncbi:beta-lactamase class A [Klenkia soli]|uniref:Beta-lactamase n=1 Tax=Klenkia soli TaxID=1052260 RepID=A0A1H0UJ68_9ACTN|nr:class A beta-lactamase [Klenkia soli]SDP66211.1 beta-lactamase class A [Klenkia soli]